MIWDGLPSHRSKAMTAWINKQRSWLVVERLPAYAPDLNPVELLWGNVKGVELANLCPRDHRPGVDRRRSRAQRAGSDYQFASTSSTTRDFLYDQAVNVLPKAL